MQFIRSAMALTAALALAGSSLAEVTLVGQPVYAPDVYGGYPTTHVVVQVQPGHHPIPAIAQSEGLFFGDPKLDATLAIHGVQSVGPVVAFPFGNPELAAQIGLDRYYLVNVPPGSDVRALAAALKRFPQVFSSVELDGIGGVADTIPNDTAFTQLWGMHNTGQNTCAGVGTPDADIDAPGAWDLWTGENDVTLAVIDSGVQNHVDFGNKVLQGWNTVLNNTQVSDADCPHGTHCTGTATAIGNNNLGVAGVSWGALILPVKVLTGCSGNETDCGEGIIWAADHGANVGTMSLQYYTGIQFFKDAVAYGHNTGMVLIAANGNNAGNVIAYPAKFPLCMGVGATRNNDTIASFSNYGPECDLSAPGENVWSTLQTNTYDCYSGTSMATPHTSGLACLLWSYNPGLTNDQVIAALIANVDDKGAPGWDQFFGWGRINAERTLVNNPPGLSISVVGTPPNLLAPGQTADFTVRVRPGPDTLIPGSEKLHYRYNGGVYQTVALVSQGGELYTATLPAPNCNSTPEFYVSAESQESGVRTAPYNAPTNVFSADVGVLVTNTIYTQNFNSGIPQGWTATGLWKVTNNCPVGQGSCDGGTWAYYGQIPACNFDVGTTAGNLTATPITLPSIGPSGSLKLRFCYTLETENLAAYDQATVRVNGSEVLRCAESPSSWSTAEVSLAAYSGQQVTIAFRFDSVDGLYNSFRGWQVDGMQIIAQTVECVDVPGCVGDIDGDGFVGQSDLGILLGNFGQNVPPNTGGDLDGDGFVGQSDLGILLGDFGCQE
ncbi:MAG: S8 family serine peptidase [Phycisphaerae bacterium]|nr:S8 family serine peptidase [Phycisphaerae bacterium]MCZ2400263.1 S8 family serine peptidase [Phycisphaerae bacterium]